MMWWRPNERGYTGSIEEAGRYLRPHAEEIITHATCGGALFTARTDPITGETYQQYPEVMVLAPEYIPDRT